MFIAFLALQFVGLPPPNALWTKAIEEHRACLLAKSAQLEPSDADFDDIFAAAQTACAGSWLVLFEQAKTMVETGPRVRSGEDPSVIAKETADSIENDFKAESRLIVLRMRSARKQRENAPKH